MRRNFARELVSCGGARTWGLGWGVECGVCRRILAINIKMCALQAICLLFFGHCFDIVLSCIMASLDLKDGAAEAVDRQRSTGLAANMSPERRAEVEKKLKRKLDARCSLFVLIYIMNYLDRYATIDLSIFAFKWKKKS